MLKWLQPKKKKELAAKENNKYRNKNKMAKQKKNKKQTNKKCWMRLREENVNKVSVE